MRRPGGLIPAHAGKTLGQDSTGRSGWAHPRSRGENVTPSTGVVRVEGSSPLTRGKHRDRRADTRRQGLIPAHAGKTVIPVATQIGQAAHPRSRGENQQAAIEEQKGKGSSPLTRGKLGIGVGDVGDGGLIPAHAGKTEVQEVGGTMPGLIPAHAGKTARFRPGRAGRSAHPRSRGENAMPRSDTSPIAGSSPLTRGKRHQGDQ